MRCNRLVGSLVSTVALGVATAASAQQPSEARIQELIRVAAERVAQGQTPTTQTPIVRPSAPDTRPVVRLSLDDAVKLALDRNLDIAVQRLNPQINDIAIASLRSVYHPSLTSQVFTRATTQPTTTTISGTNQAGAGIDTTLTTYNGGIAQNFYWGGGSLAVALNNNRQTTTNQTTFFNPTYNTNWSGTYTQPLLRGFRTDNTRQQLQVTKINRDISDVQLKASVTNTLSNVRNAYWDYVYAVQAVEVARQSLDLASKLVQDNQTRVQVGTMAPIDVVQAQSEQATRSQTLVTAESTKRTTELALKRLIVSGTDDANWSSALDPTDRPDFRPAEIDIEAAIRRALSERTDMDVAKKNVQANDVTLKYLNDQTLPQADLVATYGLVGIGGSQLITEGSGINRTVTGSLPGGYFDALSSLFHTNYPTWTVQMNFSYPLGLSSQQASVARARVQLNQVQAQLKQIELQVATEVTNAAINARNTAEAVQAAQAARELSQRKLEAEQSKFEVGMSTNYFVVQAQRDLADAQNSELRAVLNYRKALVELERSQATTLQSSNITLLSGGGAGGGGATTSAAAAAAAANR
jgi:outer membrane protein